MKKLIILFTLISLTSVQAQFLNNYGFSAGLNYNHQEWDYTDPAINFNPDNAAGFNIGAFAEFLEIKNYELRTELNFIQRGIKEELLVTSPQNPNGNGTTKTASLKSNYISLALLAKAKMNLILVNPYFIAGPFAEYELGKAKNDIGTLGDELKEWQYGFKAGIGSEVNLGVTKLYAEITYNRNLGSLYNSGLLKITSYFYDFKIGLML